MSSLLFFPHIPKAGGETLKELFFSTFSPEEMLKVWNTNFGADIEAEDFEWLPNESLRGIRAVFGHLSVQQFLSNRFARALYDDGRVTIVSSVRHPIDRIISLYNYTLAFRAHPNNAHSSLIDRQDWLRWQPCNFQVTFLDLVFDCNGPVLPPFYHVFPIESSIDGFSSFFKETFGTDIGTLAIKNKTIDFDGSISSFSKAGMDRELINQLESAHHLDIALYSHLQGLISG